MRLVNYLLHRSVYRCHYPFHNYLLENCMQATWNASLYICYVLSSVELKLHVTFRANLLTTPFFEFARKVIMVFLMFKSHIEADGVWFYVTKANIITCHTTNARFHSLFLAFKTNLCDMNISYRDKFKELQDKCVGARRVIMLVRN